MISANTFMLQFSFEELRIIKEAFNELCNGFYLPDFEAETGMTRDSAKKYFNDFWPIYVFMNDLEVIS